MVKEPHTTGAAQGGAGRGRRPRFGWLGLALGAGAWAASTQAGLSLVPVACASAIRWPAIASAILAVAALAGTAASWRAMRGAGGLRRFGGETDGRPRLFLAVLGVASGALFVLVILSQAAAGLILTGCER